MACFFSMNNKPNIKMFDLTPPGDDFNYLRPEGTITLSIDKKYQVPLSDISVRLWPKHTEQREQFLLLQRTPPSSPSISSLSDSGINTVI